jgi:catechol 2,3-dioxygenase-like lactoylglutathione lyase family enzyme
MADDGVYRITTPEVNMKLATVELRVRDWPAAVTWFRDVFGLKVLLRVDDDGYALLQTGTAHLALKRTDTGPLPADADARPLLLFEVDDVERELARLTAHGVAILKPLRVSAENYRRVIVAGPEGQPILLFDWRGA